MGGDQPLQRANLNGIIFGRTDDREGDKPAKTGRMFDEMWVVVK